MMPDIEASSSVREPPTTELGCGTSRASRLIRARPQDVAERQLAAKGTHLAMQTSARRVLRTPTLSSQRPSLRAPA